MLWLSEITLSGGSRK